MPQSANTVFTLDSDIFKCCRDIVTLGWMNDLNARTLLRRAADHVKPIMARRKWVVPVLREFYPANSQLLGLNVNSGESIMIRLRRPQDKSQFFDYEEILHTLLHELAHVECGPHDAFFYRLLDELIIEAAQTTAPSTSGTACGQYVGAGQRLGDHRVPSVPRHRASTAAAAAAEKRAQRRNIMGSGRLGGESDSFHRHCDPRELAVAAAERRKLDEIWCSSGSTAARNNAVARTSSAGLPPNVIDLETSRDATEERSTNPFNDDFIVID